MRRAHPRPADSRSAEQLRTAVDGVLDPELDQPIGSLGMVDGVEVNRRGRVVVRLALATPESSQLARLLADVEACVHEVLPQAEVEVRTRTMPEVERRAAADQFLAARPSRGAGSAASVVAIASGKGGVGKSSVAANLAVALAQQGKRVGLLDADVWGYSIPQLFGVTTAPVAMYETMLPLQAYGVRLMSLGFLVEEETPIVWRGPMLHKALAQFVDDVHWGPLDVLLVDLPPGTGDVTLSLMELLPDVSLLVVTTPQLAARTVASRVGVMARSSGIPISGVVENMSELVCETCGGHTALFGSGGGAHLAAQLGAPLLGQVPLDLPLRQSGDDGVPVVLAHPDSASAIALRAVAAALRPARRPLAGRHLTLTPV